MKKLEILENFGLCDGNDEHRYDYAKILSGELDYPVWMCFSNLVRLEKKGLIELDIKMGKYNEKA